MPPNQENQPGPPAAPAEKGPEPRKTFAWYDDAPVLPVIVRSQIAFYRDLPELLRTNDRQWVAYHGDKRIGFGRTETELYNRCLRLGLDPNEFVTLLVHEAALYDHEEIDLPTDV
jgi:hypothetical protein